MKSKIDTSLISETNENEKLRNEVEELKKIVNSLVASKEKEEKKPRQPRRQQSAYEEISPNYYVRIMSLVDNPLNLNTKPKGQGKPIRFETFGEIQKVFYSDLLDINRNHKNFLEAGYYLILDEKVIKDIGLEKLYEKVLNKDQIENILTNSENAISLFETANDKQRNVIIDFFVQRIVSGQNVDFNLISNISRISGVDILERSKHIKETTEANK